MKSFASAVVISLLLSVTDATTMEVEGMATCKCTGTLTSDVAKFDCTYEWAIDGKCVSPAGADRPDIGYPPNYGTKCSKHLEPGATACFDVNATPPVEIATNTQAAWCNDAWCYVDPCACDAPATRTYYFLDAYLFYSYDTCKSSDQFTAAVKGGTVGNDENCGTTSKANGDGNVLIPSAILGMFLVFYGMLNN